MLHYKYLQFHSITFDYTFIFVMSRYDTSRRALLPQHKFIHVFFLHREHKLLATCRQDLAGVRASAWCLCHSHHIFAYLEAFPSHVKWRLVRRELPMRWKLSMTSHVRQKCWHEAAHDATKIDAKCSAGCFWPTAALLLPILLQLLVLLSLYCYTLTIIVPTKVLKV